MARPLRLDLAGGWYHVMNRGHRSGTLFFDDTDRRRFLGAVAELPERFGVEVHAFVLMDNHYHLLIRTREANLSHAIRWVNVTYGVKFNWAHRTHGAVFQGRFKSVLIQEERRAVEVARYIHLNPVRIDGLGLSKSDQRAARVLGCDNPGAELVKRRLETLETYPWSSWRIYMGAETNPGWLQTDVIGQACGGRNRAARIAALRAYTEQPVRQGGLENPWAGLVGGVVLGEKSFAERVLSGKEVNEDEQTAVRLLRKGVSWEELIRAAEEVRGESSTAWWERHGDWWRDGLMYVAVRHGGLRLSEVVRHAGVKYQAGAQAVKRFRVRLAGNREREQFVAAMRDRMSNI